ncbi:MAG: hypothetical protein ACFFCQ_02680 [Promethearchaeota archaeon]
MKDKNPQEYHLNRDSIANNTVMQPDVRTTHIGKYLFQNLIIIINTQSILIALIAVILTYLSIEFEFYADIPTSFIGIAIIFPIVFSINSAYRRREEALSYFASIMANSAALFFAHKDWTKKKNIEHTKRINKLLIGLFTEFKEFFTSKEPDSERVSSLYSIFSQISDSNERLRTDEVSPPEISRANQFLSMIILSFERMRTILTYRTPLALRAYSRFFLNASPLLFAPYFAYLADRFDNPIFGYALAILFSIVLVSLDKIQDDLENPYDTIGKDDIRFDEALAYIEILNNQIGINYYEDINK